MNSIHSIHSLVRLLKVSSDAPSALGPSKIEIASLSWSDPSFRAANKGEVIGEWILTLLGQARKTRRERVDDPIADPRYWTLLSKVLTTPPSTIARPMKTWLLPLLNRLQLDAIVIELLAARSTHVLVPARAALAVLWPLAERKISVDALADCLSAVLDACAEWGNVDDNLTWICSILVSTYRNTLANTGNKKKLYNSFLTTHLGPWLCIIRANPSLVSISPAKQLQDNIYAAGTDTLFSLDALKQPLDVLFDCLSLSNLLISSLLPTLPKFFASFLTATYRHRSALFASTTSVVGSKEEARKRGMEFVQRCWPLIGCSASICDEFEVDRWKAVVGVFEIVHKEHLFIARSIRGVHSDTKHGENQWETVLSEARDKVIEVLECSDASFTENRAELLVLSTQLLDVLVQIEYDFIGPTLERILSALISIPLPQFDIVRIPSSELLAHILDYHTKTRTVHTYALALLGAAIASSASLASISSSTSIASVFPLAYHLPALAHALRTSLILTQATPLATAVLHAVNSAWTVFKGADRGEGRSAKKQKVTDDPDDDSWDRKLAPAHAQAFSYTGWVAGTVLSNLPPNVYVKDGKCFLEHTWEDIAKLGWSVIWDSLGENIRKDCKQITAKSTHSKKRELAVEVGHVFAHCRHVVTSAALRFLYEIRSRLCYPLGECDRIGEVPVRRLLDVIRDEASDPGLVLETVRTLLWFYSYIYNREPQEQPEIHSIFTVILDILATHLSIESRWSGVSADITRENLGLAVLYVLTDRWIDMFDALASAEELNKLIALLFTVSLDSPDENTQENSDKIHSQSNHVLVTLRGILLSLLHNAQFWELHNIRTVFLSSASTLTLSLSYSIAATEALLVTETELTLACNVFRLLHFVPPEYFTRFLRTELVKRAMVADRQICIHISGGLKSWSRQLTFVRAFLQHMGRFLNTFNHTISSDFVTHLLTPPSCIYSPSKILTDVTLDLIQLHTTSLLRSQEPEAATSFSNIISTLSRVRPYSQPNSQETWAHTITQSSILELIQHLTGDFGSDSLSDIVKCALKTLLEALESSLSLHVQTLMEKDVELDQLISTGRINAWSRTLSLRRWLGMNSLASSNTLGTRLAKSLICRETSFKRDFETCSNILELLFQELWCMPELSHHAQLDVLVSFYAVTDGDRNGHIMDTHVTRSSRKLSAQDFSCLLDVLAGGIGGGGLQAGRRERLIHLAKIMLHDAPQGTLRVIQNFATQCLSLFTGWEETYGSSSRLKFQFLEFIARHCSDRPAAIRSVDLGSIWSLLNKVLSGSPDHDPTTAFPIFHHIVTIISALVRLRRDLVVHTLPHLSLVLRQLIMLTRKIRPQLGAKQNKFVTDTFPSWLAASQPLSTDEARALARLLTSLTTKSVPRTHVYAHSSTSTESQKAASLAKPFAKHAPYVLVAYVDAFNDPLCIINAEMRRDLEPGLFALCEMVGEHSRDALMVSALDVGGKSIMKSLWREYEKQRYVGKG